MKALLHPYLCKLFISADLKQHSVKARNRPAAPLCSKSISPLISSSLCGYRSGATKPQPLAKLRWWINQIRSSGLQMWQDCNKCHILKSPLLLVYQMLVSSRIQFYRCCANLFWRTYTTLSVYWVVSVMINLLT